MSALMRIHESGMQLPCDAENTFFCEEVLQTAGIQHVMPVEFIAKKGKKLLLVEAKSSAPNSKNKEDFHKYINEIAQKAVDSFSLLLAARLGRWEEKIPLCPNLATADYGAMTVSLVLVIRQCRTEWLAPVRDSLLEELRHFIAAWHWGPQPVMVLNEELAVKKKFVARAEDEAEAQSHGEKSGACVSGQGGASS